MANFDKVANVSIRDDVLERYHSLVKELANPNSTHTLGEHAKNKYDEACQQIRTMIPGYQFVEFVPGGGSIANRRAIIGSIPVIPKFIDKETRRDMILISSIEHRSIETEVSALLKLKGYHIVQIPVSKEGVVNLSRFEELLIDYKKRICLVSIMTINNEIGTIQPISEIRELMLRLTPDAIFHSDICHSVKVSCPYPDILTLSFYKVEGFHLGLVLSMRPLLTDHLWTPDVAMISASTLALKLYMDEYQVSCQKTYLIKKKLGEKLEKLFQESNVEYVRLDRDCGAPNIIAFLLPFQGSTVQKMLSDRGVYVGIGSACASIGGKGSHVISALGYNDANQNLIRLSFGPNQEEEIELVVTAFQQILPLLNLLRKDSVQSTKSNEVKFEIPESTQNVGEKIRLECPLDLPVTEIKYKYLRVSVGEAFLKGDNRDLFLKQLSNNIAKTLKVKPISQRLLFMVPCDETWRDTVELLQTVPGISKIVPVIEVNTVESMVSIVTAMIQGLFPDEDKIKFKIETKIKPSKKYLDKSSQTWNTLIGQYIVDRFADRVEVNLNNPRITVRVEFYQRKIYISCFSFAGIDGLPVGTEGKLTCMVGTDNYLRSILACYLMSRRGVQIDLMVLKMQENDPEIRWTVEMVRRYQPDMQVIVKEEMNEPDRNIIFEVEGDGKKINVYKRLKEYMEKTGHMIINCTLLMQPEEILIKLNEIGFFVEPDINEIKTQETGKVLSLISGGIDSPVASYILLKEGFKVEFLHFASDINKIDNLLKIREKLGSKGKLTVVDFKPVIESVVKNCPESYRTLMYKIYMIIIANKLAIEERIDAIATGNSWGQVASQTPENLRITELCSDLPIINPLIGYCKSDIINVARQIGTYEDSICDGTDDCCVMYLPKHPVLKGDIAKVGEYTKRVGLVIIDNLTLKYFY